MKLDELNALEDEIDEEDERIFEAYRLYCINCQLLHFINDSYKRMDGHVVLGAVVE